MTFMIFMFADWEKLKVEDIIGNDEAINLKKDFFKKKLNHIKLKAGFNF